MKMRRLVAVMVFTLLIVGCAPADKKQQQVSLSSPFVGGTQGIALSFQNLRSEVYDNGRDPFDVVVKLENKGETLVNKADVQVKLSGINPSEFDKSESNLILKASDDVIELRKDPQGNVIPPPPAFVEFTGLNNKGKITGATAQFTLRADLCYVYKTKAVSKLCVREDLLTPKSGGICEINQDKPVFNSGAPVQFSNFKESTRAKDKVGFTFEVRNVGGGSIFERSSICNRNDRKMENRVYVVVSSGISGVQCT